MMRPTVLLLLLLLCSHAAAQGKNILFYGNSYTFYSWGYGVPELVGLIAEEASEPTPTIVQALLGGSDIEYHATNPGQVAAISSSLPAGQTWDHVVVQGNSLDATPHFGFTPTGFRNNAVTIAGNVRSHSPNATVVMYQTWARSWGHMYYPVPWTEPMDMHNMVRGNYDLAVADINAAFGAGTASKAAVGDAVALLEWNPSWYDPDLSHPGPSMTLLAAMCIYSSIYGAPACSIDPDFTPGSPLELALSPHGIDESTWNILVGVADRSASRLARSYPGSGDHLLLESANGAAPVTACSERQITAGTQVSVQLRSLNSVFDQAPAWLLVDFFLTGSPPGPSPNFPEVQFDAGRTIVLASSSDLQNPLGFSWPMPFSLPGGSFLVQGLVWQASPETGNAVFATTDACELVMF